MLDDHTIIGVHITNRVQHAVEVQNVLTSHGNRIRTRIGLHDAGDGSACSANGLLLIEFVGSESECAELVGKLKAIAGVDVQKIVFTHP